MNHCSRTFSVIFLLAAASTLSGCGDHGFLGTDYQPKGDIRVTDSAGTATIATSATSPYHSGGGSFTVGITETNFSGPYTVTITAWNNGTNKPCFGATAVTATGSPAIEQFSSVNANSSGGTTPNPCVTGAVDTETALISDGKGNTANFYFTLTGAAESAAS